jgi:hypothetical protein
MGTSLNPLYGDYINDTTLAKSAGFRPGIIIAPTIAGVVGTDDITFTITPDSDLGLWAWRTRWTTGKGSFTITEDEAFTVTTLSLAANPYQMLVARWEWVAGPLDADGNPYGTFEDTMKPVYQFEPATAADMAQGLIKSSIAQPDSNGRYGVVLGVLSGALMSFQNSTFIDLAYLGGRASKGSYFFGTKTSSGAFDFSTGVNTAFRGVFTPVTTTLTAITACNVLCTYTASVSGGSGGGSATWSTTATINKNGSAVASNEALQYASAGTGNSQINAVVTAVISLAVGDTLSFTQTNSNATEIDQKLTIVVL